MCVVLRLRPSIVPNLFFVLLTYRIFCFAYMVEGASGFGTPVALGAPMLVSSGHEKLESIVLLLLMNTFATVWGAVGTPIWFGFSDVVDDEEDFFEISYKAAIALCVGAFILMPFILTILVPWKVVKQNLMFITCSLLTVVGPSLALSFFSYEFPALLGGMIGCGGTAVLIGRKVGLTTVNPDDLSSLGMMDSNSDSGTPKQMVDDGSAKDQVDERAKEKPNDEAPSSDANETGDDREGGEKHSVDNGDDNQDGSRTKQVEDSANEGHQEGGEKPTSENGNHNQDGSKTEISADYGAKKGDKKDDDGNAESEEEDRKVNDEEGTEVVIDSKTAKVTSSLSKKASAGAAPSLTQSKLSGTVPALQDDVEAHLGPRDKEGFAYVKEMLLRTFPIWSVVLLLILTRVEVFGLKELLTLTEPSFSINFGTYGIFKLSASLVFQLVQIMTFPGLDWKYEFLYIPFFIPFVVVSLTTLFIFRKDSKSSVGEIAKTVGGRLASPVFALMGALTLVQLMIETDTVAPAYILGSILSDWFKEAFVIISPLLGALGSFFSGSTTVSNKTFGQIQAIAAENIGTSVTTMLALQSVGASAGNGICLNNIISACTVVGLTIGEGQILMRTYKYVFINTTIATAVMLAFFFRFD